MQTNPLTVTAKELLTLPMEERRRILEFQADAHLKLKSQALRRASKIVEILGKNPPFHDWWRTMDMMSQDDIMFEIEELLIADDKAQKDKL